jgi:hypothetical protein
LQPSWSSPANGVMDVMRQSLHSSYFDNSEFIQWINSSVEISVLDMAAFLSMGGSEAMVILLLPCRSESHDAPR